LKTSEQSTSKLEWEVANSISQKRQKTDPDLKHGGNPEEIKKAYPSLDHDVSQKFDEYITQLKQRKF